MFLDLCEICTYEDKDIGGLLIMEQNEIDQQQKYYKEIEACVQLENLSYFLKDKNKEIENLEKEYRGRSLPGLVWLAIIGAGLYTYFGTFDVSTIKVIAVAVALIVISLGYNMYNDRKVRSKVNVLSADRDEKQGMYNEWYSYIDSAFQKGEFSITKDCWHSGNELLKYYNDNRAFSFKEALYYVEKRRDREAMENGLRNAYSAGYSSGSSDWYNSGYNNGYNSGYHSGKRK